jgi:DNA-binding MarR family transcriptional regulator
LGCFLQNCGNLSEKVRNPIVKVQSLVDIGFDKSRLLQVRLPTKASEIGRAEEFRLEDFLPYRLSVAADAVSRLVSRVHLAQPGLGMPEWQVLAALGRFGVLSPTLVGERTSMDKVKISRAAASLAARGLLRQTRNPDDGRGRLVRLTRKGNAMYASVVTTAREVEATLAAGLTKAEWNALHRALGKLSEHSQAMLTDLRDETSG